MMSTRGPARRQSRCSARTAQRSADGLRRPQQPARGLFQLLETIVRSRRHSRRATRAPRPHVAPEPPRDGGPDRARHASSFERERMSHIRRIATGRKSAFRRELYHSSSLRSSPIWADAESRPGHGGCSSFSRAAAKRSLSEPREEGFEQRQVTPPPFSRGARTRRAQATAGRENERREAEHQHRSDVVPTNNHPTHCRDVRPTEELDGHPLPECRFSPPSLLGKGAGG